jgi:transporter family-2 protein
LTTQLIALVIGAVAGLLMAFQGSLNTALGKVVGLLEATFIVQLVGVIVTTGLLLAGLRTGNLAEYRIAPWYTYLGGLLGVGIIYAVVSAISQIGVAAATTAIIVGQVATAAIIDHFGLFGLEQHPFCWGQGVGLALLAVGAFLLLR